MHRTTGSRPGSRLATCLHLRHRSAAELIRQQTRVTVPEHGSVCRVWQDKKVSELVNVEALPDADAWARRLARARRGVVAVFADIVREAARVHELSTGAEAGAAAAQLARTTAPNRMFRIVALEGTQALAIAGKWLQEAHEAQKRAEAGASDAAAAFMRTAALRSARQPGTRREFVCDALLEALVRLLHPPA